MITTCLALTVTAPLPPPPPAPHLADDAVLHVGLLVASLLAHQSDLQLTERLGQDVTLCEELPPLHNVSFQQGRVVLVTQHPLRKSENHQTDQHLTLTDTKQEEQLLMLTIRTPLR